MYKSVCYCGLCNSKISEPDTDAFLRYRESGGQVWPIGDDEYDVCCGCLLILIRAKNKRLIEVDWSPIYERAGFVHNGSHWVKQCESVTITEAELLAAIQEEP